ncbi:MAG: FHA domain-containing protein [Acidobacteriota bacterium]|nr:FHA domain-containing protein [Acidobacteriota bacterium]
MKSKDSAFIIVREDRAVDPMTLLTEGLTIGRLPDCEMVLNHPTVSRVHAGIRETNGVFYIFHLSPSNSTTLNGSLVEEKAAITDEDVVQIGPFFLYIGREGKALTIRVVYQTAVRIGDAEILNEAATGHGLADAPQDPAAAAAGHGGAHGHAGGAAEAGGGDALDVFWDKRKREAGKITRPSPLRPKAPPRLGKARWNWMPTRDLQRPWPVSVFTWGAVLVGLFAILAAFTYTSAFSPAPLSNPHSRQSLTMTPAIAKEPNANGCTSCHSLTASMESRCASCHQTQNFDSAVIDPHAAAGIGCVTCHSEHRGDDFRPGLAPINANFQPGKVTAENTCTGCHNDANQKTFNGKRVFTPHGGTLGYPYVGGQWEWEGLSQTEWQQKPEGMKQLLESMKQATAGGAQDNEQTLRSAQFHVLHLHRVKAINGMASNESGELSCSSCHKSFGAKLDRATPRTTCAACHNGKIDAQTKAIVLGADAANCNSCHVQHTKDKRHWNPELLTPEKVAVKTPIADQRSAPLLASSH